MTNCCGIDMKTICEQFNCQINETEAGIQVNITPKDPSKTDSLKGLVKACRDFCSCC